MPKAPSPQGGAAQPSPGFMSVFPKVALPMFIALCDQSIVATALPAIGGSLGDVQQISLVIIGYLVAATVATPVYGRFGDRYGRRLLLLIALGVFMASSLICFFATSLQMLVIGRVMQGMGGGGLMALSQALIGESVAPRDRARYQGYLATVGVSSNALGPVLGGVLTEHFGWRSIFLFFIPIGLVAFALIWSMPKRRAGGETFRFDYPGFALFACFVISMLVLVQYVQKFDFSHAPLMIGLLVIAVCSVVLLVRVERRVSLPLIPVELIRNPNIWRSNVIAACHAGMMTSLLTFVPIYLRVVHETSASETGLLIVPMTVCIGIGSLITGQIVSRTGVTAVIPSWGLVFCSTGLLIIAFYAPQFRAIELSGSLGLMALFLGTVMAVVQVTVQQAAGQASLGAAAAAVQYSRSLGAALCTALVAAVLFATLAHADPEASRLFGEVLQRGAQALEDLPAGRSDAIQAEFAQAFRAAFLVIAAMAAVACAFMWTLPLRRI